MKHVHGEGELATTTRASVTVQIGLTTPKREPMLCPSDMMDGRIGAIRKGLDSGYESCLDHGIYLKKAMHVRSVSAAVESIQR